ncbi:hypothetical protein EBB59_05390 [Lysobacter pythonis]|uniref:Uncharacterized protein n=1 Tax=Solilutibacter pythonis TaxID=2483112 RepID=A0A3M2I079_9GAMM|nr:hypothetical protein [Lysobacter pythonis]RMH93320.1 hypothetical protein EBB59_05390 [Lysobacter pythonis]
MNWDALQREALAELGHVLLQSHVPGSEPPPPPDPRVLAMLAKALGIVPEALAEAGVALPALERLRDPAVKRALWPRLRGLRGR